MLLAIIILLLLPPAVVHGDGPNREYQVKAAFITKFIPFIEWPAETFKNANDPLVITVVNDASGHDPFDNVLDQFAAEKTSAGHPLKVKHVDPDADLTGCHVLFVPASQDAKLKAILKNIEKQPILTVGESDQFPWSGGAVRFFLEDNKVRFEVNSEAIKAAKLVASSKFLALGKQFKKS